MEAKLNKRKIGLLTQAAIASGVMLLPVSSAFATNIEDIAAPANITDGKVAHFTANVVGTLLEDRKLGLPDAVDQAAGVASNLSAYTDATTTGTLIFQGKRAPAQDDVPGNLGQSTALFNLITFDPQTNGNTFNIIGSVYTEDMNFANSAAGGEAMTATIKGDTTIVTNAIDFAVNVNNTLAFDSTNNNMTVTTGGVNNAGNAIGTLNFLGGNTITYSGEIGATNALTAVNINGGTTLNLSDNVAATGTTINGTSILNVNDTGKTINGTLTVAGGGGTVNIGSNKLNVTGVVTFGANDIFALQTSDATEADGLGLISSPAANAAVDVGAKLNITPIGYLSNGNNITILNGNAGGVGVNNIPAANITGQSAVLGFTTQAVAGPDLILTVARTPYTSATHGLASDASGIGGALELDGAAGRLAASNPTMELAVGAIDRLATSAEVNDALAQLGPTGNLAIGQSAQIFTNQTIGTVNDRLNIARSGDTSYNTGMSAGDMYDGWGVWGEIFGSDFTQKKRNGVYGYDGSTLGLTLGVDWNVNPDTLIGLAVSYSSTDVDYDLGTGSTLDVDSIQGSIYGSYEIPDSPWYVQGLLGVTRHDYDQYRAITIPNAPAGVAVGDFDAWEWLANVEVGYVYNEADWRIVPTLGLKYSHLDIDKYTETGAGGYNLTVANEDIDQFVASLGVLAQYIYNYGTSKVIPEAHAKVLYDFIADRQVSTSNLFATGTAFKTQSYEPAKTSFEVGVGLNIRNTKDSVFSVNYDYNFKSDFHAHSGFVKLRYQWK